MYRKILRFGLMICSALFSVYGVVEITDKVTVFNILFLITNLFLLYASIKYDDFFE